MSAAAHRRSQTIALISDLPAEEAQASWWRPVSWRWPSFAPAPGLRVLGWEGALSGEGGPLQACAALVIAPEEGRTREVYRLLDRLQEEMTPAVVIGRGGPGGAGSDESAIWFDSLDDASSVAVALASLALRQRTVESLRSEVRVSRRFQSGLRGQIEKVHEELQLAASVQREFLPRSLPAFPGLDMHVLFRPCGYVSGDIYDALRLDEHHLGFFVADAVGHGVPAALMTMVLCRCLTTVERDGDGVSIVSPGRTLERLNEDLVSRHGEGSRFATAVYGVIDARTRRVTVAGAGHPYPLRIGPGGVERVQTEGGLLGISAGSVFSEASFTLGEDEALVVYTDGFETAFPAVGADEYGRRLPNCNYVERFAEMAARCRREGMAAAVRGLTQEIDLQAGSLHQTDDLTAMFLAPRVEGPLDRLFSGTAPARGTQHAPGQRAEAG